MAIFHLSAKVISRGKGQSAIAAAAYRSGERLQDEQDGTQKFYRARSERIVFTDIMAPPDAPEWAHDREQLWNRAERAEKRKDAQLAREIEVALPHELTDQQREYLVKDFAREAFVRKGYAVDIAIHAPDKTSDERNHHAHLLVTRRTLGPEGFAATKDWQFDKTQLGQWREQWAHLANRHLERHGHDARLDHRSLKEQGADREPTVHLGYAAAGMAQRGAQSDRMDELRGILARNEIRLDMKALDAELRGLERAEAEQARAAAREREARGGLATAERAFGDGARDAAQEERQTRREARETAQQEAWRDRRDAEVARVTDAGKPGTVGGGLRVVDGATGAVCGLVDFVGGLLAGSSGPPARQADMGAFVSDPAARKAQQLARLAEARAERARDRALERIREDVEAGRNLKAEDIQRLPRTHQEQIAAKGDAAVLEIIADARKRTERSWTLGDDRERER